MADFPKIPQRPFPIPPIAEAADIPRPQPEIVRTDEVSAQKQQSKSQEQTQSKQNAQALQNHFQEIQEKGERVENPTQALMSFLRQGGSQMSTDVLLAEAAILAGMPKGSKNKKKRFFEIYRNWAWGHSTLIITKVINRFRSKK
jgi:hypothetical protein